MPSDAQRAGPDGYADGRPGQHPGLLADPPRPRRARTPHHAHRLLPALATRRHIDLVRTSSAICQPA
ncbi:putative leader peptide [Streptomyces sp. NBC_00503]|uniref:putative leader peptide n=1 Tax=Streptomyces sp. NBC_00503 TaxID=2903659 RepID=UPI003FCE2FF2